MEFTFDAYRGLLRRLRDCGYTARSYHDWKPEEKCVILRHDIDEDIAQAVRFGLLEQEENVASTYYVLLTGDFYNVFSAKNAAGLQKLASCGHEIGLHFDEKRYPELFGNVGRVQEKILQEARILSDLLGRPVRTVSMHRPSREMLEADLQIPGLVNSYGEVYFKQFKYLSDSRRRWREPVEEIIDSGAFPQLHILTHAFWYAERKTDIRGTLASFIARAGGERYDACLDNISDLPSILTREEIL